MTVQRLFIPHFLCSVSQQQLRKNIIVKCRKIIVLCKFCYHSYSQSCSKTSQKSLHLAYEKRKCSLDNVVTQWDLLPLWSKKHTGLLCLLLCLWEAICSCQMYFGCFKAQNALQRASEYYLVSPWCFLVDGLLRTSVDGLLNDFILVSSNFVEKIFF